MNPFKLSAFHPFMLVVSSAIPVCVSAAVPFVQDGKAGFVLSHIEYALSDSAATDSSCPNGLSLSPAELFALTPGGAQGAAESEDAYAKRVWAGVRKVGTSDDGQDLCMNPTAGVADPYYRTVQGSELPAFGLDLDGHDSSLTQSFTPGSCAHDDFFGVNGESGIDNQFLRVVGCSRSYQPTGLSNSFAIEMLAGAWGMLVSLSDVDSVDNDDHVGVVIAANADPLRLSPGREPLAYATYALDQDSRFRATTSGRITDGVLTTEPVDVRFHHVVNSMNLERPLRDARLHVTLSETGTFDGYLSGYAPVEAMYDYQYGYRSGTDGSGKLASLRLRAGSAHGAAHVLGHTCVGAYQALRAHADGHPDPETGKCTSISTQYRIQAVPAFVVDVQTESLNRELEKNNAGRQDY